MREKGCHKPIATIRSVTLETSYKGFLHNLECMLASFKFKPSVKSFKQIYYPNNLIIYEKLLL